MPKKLKMPLPYLSYSAWDLYLRDPMEFYMQYFVGRVDKATDKMTLGKIFQEAWSDPKYNYIKELRDAGFTSNWARIIKTALEHPQTIRLPKRKCEKKLIVQGLGLNWPVMGIFDGDDEDARLIVENKFGAPWNQARADEAKQLTWYAMVCKIKRGYIPKQVLQSINSKTGIPSQYWTRRTNFDIDKLVGEINEMIANVEAGNFEPK